MFDRWNVRLPVRMEVALHLLGNPPIAANARDVSLEGVYIEIRGMAIPRNTAIEVEFPLPYGRQEKRYRVPAAVTRVEPQGIALMFTDYGWEVREGLTDLIDIYLSNLAP